MNLTLGGEVSRLTRISTMRLIEARFVGAVAALGDESLGSVSLHGVEEVPGSSASSGAE